jgi:hypothetical protein
MKVFVVKRLIEQLVPQKSYSDLAHELGFKTAMPLIRLAEFDSAHLTENASFKPNDMKSIAEYFCLNDASELLSEGFEFYYKGGRQTWSVRLRETANPY